MTDAEAADRDFSARLTAPESAEVEESLDEALLAWLANCNYLAPESNGEDLCVTLAELGSIEVWSTQLQDGANLELWARLEELTRSLNRLLEPLAIPSASDATSRPLARFVCDASISADAETRGVALSLRLCADHCGFASFWLADRLIHWHCPPKLDADWLGLLAIAEGWPELRLGRWASLSQRTDPSPALVLAWAYITALRRLVDPALAPTADDAPGNPQGPVGLRRSYDHRREVLQGRMRGQLDRSAYVRQLARGRPDRAPCRFDEHDLDHVFNRALRWALHMAIGLIETVGAAHEHTRALANEARRLDARFGGVSWRRLTRDDLPRLANTPRSLRGYESSGAMPIARFLLRRLHIGNEGAGTPLLGMAFRMHRLFERACAVGLARCAGVHVDAAAQHRWDVTWRPPGATGGSQGNPLIPDLYLPHAACVVVADTKWKDTMVRAHGSGNGGHLASEPSDEIGVTPETSAVGVPQLKVLRSDLHQIIAYGLAAAARCTDPHQPVVAALIYPTLVMEGCDAATPLVATWPDAGTAARAIQVVAIGWPVGPVGAATDLTAGLRTLWRRLASDAAEGAGQVRQAP